MNHLTISQCKVIWIAGAIQRLFTLNYLSGHMPFWIEPEGIDDFMKIDEHRLFLFPDDSEIKDIFTHLMSRVKNKLSPELYEIVVELLIQYKNDRDSIVRHSLLHSVK